MDNQIDKSFFNSDEFTYLIEECKAILAEGRFVLNVETLKTKWELGKRINENELDFQRAGYGDKVVEVLSVALDVSPQTLWKCMQFNKKFNELQFDTVLQKIEIEGKAPSWHKVCREILPVHKENNVMAECEHENMMCLKCRKRFTNKNVKQNGVQT